MYKNDARVWIMAFIRAQHCWLYFEKCNRYHDFCLNTYINTLTSCCIYYFDLGQE